MLKELRFYLPNAALRALTFGEWRKMGGNGIGQREAGNVAIVLEMTNKKLDHLTLGQIADANSSAARTIARYARENFPDKDWTILEGVWTQKTGFVPENNSQKT